MAVINEIIVASADGKLSFGDYQAVDKKKKNDFELSGDMYSVRTHKLVTRLEKNGSLLIETVPGATVHDFLLDENSAVFSLEGFEDTQVTMELEGSVEYKIYLNNAQVGFTTSTLSGKINFSADLNETPTQVRIQKN